MIYTVGDSHAQWSFCGIDGVKVSSVSMLPMCKVADPNDTDIFVVGWDIPITAADVLIVSSGEIDCRYYIKLQMDSGKGPLEDLLRDLVARYVARVKTLPANGARLGILGVPPPVPEGKILCGGMGTYLTVNGSNAERVEYVTTLNRLLAEACAANGLIFIDAYTAYCDAEGLLNPELSDGCVHIRQTAAIRAQLQGMGLI